MRVGVWSEVGGGEAEVAPVDGAPGEGCGEEEAGAAEEVDGELVEGPGGGYGWSLVRGFGGRL